MCSLLLNAQSVISVVLSLFSSVCRELFFCIARFFCLFKQNRRTKTSWLFLLYQYNQCQSVTVSISFSHKYTHTHTKNKSNCAHKTLETGQFLVCHDFRFLFGIFFCDFSILSESYICFRYLKTQNSWNSRLIFFDYHDIAFQMHHSLFHFLLSMIFDFVVPRLSLMRALRFW